MKKMNFGITKRIKEMWTSIPFFVIVGGLYGGSYFLKSKDVKDALMVGIITSLVGICTYFILIRKFLNNNFKEEAMTSTKNLNWETKIDFIKNTLGNSEFSDFLNKFPHIVEAEARNFLAQREFGVEEKKMAHMWSSEAEDLMRRRILKYFAKVAERYPC